MTHKTPNTPVLIVQDCRDGAPATGQTGIYEGDYPRGALVFLHDGTRQLYYDQLISGELAFTSGQHSGQPLVDLIPYWSPGDAGPPHPLGPHHPITRANDPQPPYWFATHNPRIRLPDESVIWGDECWWTPASTAPPLAQAQADLEEHKAVLLSMAQALEEENPK